MKITIDTDQKTLHLQEGTSENTFPLYSKDAFEIISRQWIKVGWAERYSYSFTWLGRPIIQLPEDMIRTQEAIFQVRPTVILETGVAHGGSLIYSSSLLKLLGGGKVIGIDIEIRSHNREAIEAHPMADQIYLIEGSSTAPEVVEKAKALIGPQDRVLVILDSNHSFDHVLEELNIYHHLVSPGSFIVATDGIMFDLEEVPGGQPGWATDNPKRAAEVFLRDHPEFELQSPPRLFQETKITEDLTYWPGAWLRRKA